MIKDVFLQQSRNLTGKDKTLFGLLFLLLITAYPYVFCQFLPIPSVNVLTISFLIIFSFIVVIQHKNNIELKKLLWVVGLQIVAWLFFSLYHNDSSYITRIVFMMTCVTAIMCLTNVKGRLGGFIKCYNNFILLMAIGGSISFFLSILGVISPLFLFENSDGRPAYFFGLTCTNSYHDGIMRYAGFFDEPGAMAYWGVFALIFNRLFFQNRRYEIALIVCLIFTFSLAFYIQLILYILFFYVDLKKLKSLFVITVLLSLIGGGIYMTKDTSFDLYYYTFRRFEIDETTGTLAHNNRESMMYEAEKLFQKEPIMGNGASRTQALDVYMSDNPYETLARDGIVGTIVIYFPLLLILLYGLRKDKYVFFGALILAAGYLQRPFHINVLHPMMLYMLFVMVQNRKEYIYANNL